MIEQRWLALSSYSYFCNSDSTQIQINTTLGISRLIGLEAAKHKVKAFVRIQLPFYDTGSSSKSQHTEKEDIKPVNTIGIWWHETLRVLAAIEGYGSRVYHYHLSDLF